MDLEDTIAAVASASGGALRGIVRISGPQCGGCVRNVVRLPDGETLDDLKIPILRRGTMSLPELGEIPATLYFWPTRRSYTRQPSAELHLHGSPPLVDAVLATICRAGARLALPGEFTLRALLAGRLDLTQAEAVLGVIDAQSQGELDTALGQLAGGLARPLHSLRERLLDLLAHLEAGLDFAEEEIEFISRKELDSQLAAAQASIQPLTLRMHQRGEASRLPRIVLAGSPNVGKSSLLNALSGEATAIVSETAGTTRDFVGRRVVCDGRECLVVDTAGVQPRAPADEIEAASERMAETQIRQADLIVLCLDASRPLRDWERDQFTASSKSPRVVVWTKCDLPPAPEIAGDCSPICTSSKTGAGISDLKSAIARHLVDSSADENVVAGTADRCRDSLRLASAALERARAATNNAAGEELVAAELHIALDELGRVVGAVYTDDVLDRIFSRFCIGK